MSDDALYASDISELPQRIRAGEVSPVALAESCFRRIARLEPKVRAFITLTADRAMADAARVETEIRQGRWRGPLHGIPIALKDLFDTAGVRTTAASRILADRVPDRDATSVSKLRDAGAVILGKTNLQEFAYGVTTDSSFFGPTHNPWDLTRVVGGSSGGSGAALAAGMCALATGTDTGGSIRIPAALCGVVGLKPTYGRVSCTGVLPLSWSFDHPGPMARSVLGVAILLQAMAGYDRSDPASVDCPVPDYVAGLEGGVAGVRVGYDPRWTLEEVDSEVYAAFREALRMLQGLGAQVIEIALDRAMEGNAAASTMLSCEAGAVHEEWLASRASDYQPDVRARLEKGLTLRGIDYARARRAGELSRRELAESLRSVHLIATPSTAAVACPIGERQAAVDGKHSPVLAAYVRFTRVFNLTGLPAVSLPCGFSAEGLPIGLQLAGRDFEEAVVLRAARAYEKATPWAGRRPPLD